MGMNMTPVEIADPELGTMRLCRVCGEPWPRDPEFFNRDGRGYFRTMCRACEADQRRERRRR